MSTIVTRIAGLVIAAAATSGAVAGPVGAPAGALAPARSVVTTQADGIDLSGTVRSPRAACVEGRRVIVMKQVGARGGGNDILFTADTADSDGDWSTGNTGTAGRFYAKVKANPTCARDLSPTVRAVRDN